MAADEFKIPDGLLTLIVPGAGPDGGDGTATVDAIDLCGKIETAFVAIPEGQSQTMVQQAEMIAAIVIPECKFEKLRHTQALMIYDKLVRYRHELNTGFFVNGSASPTSST
jgi:hypothetical protein